MEEINKNLNQFVYKPVILTYKVKIATATLAHPNNNFDLKSLVTNSIDAFGFLMAE